MPASRMARAAVIRLSARERANGESASVIASAPALRIRRAAARRWLASASTGGSISTSVTGPRASFSASGFTLGTAAGASESRASAYGAASALAQRAAARRMCSGVVPQHPPSRFTPAACNAPAWAAKCAASMVNTVLPSRNSGSPALGLAIRGILA
ncbi:hypothetical protein SDC9_202144 [bioreactor metagenome]|uniref:Uncharacterized protein n=1 Tax=bioreactor metagenome TaxID=1076179 RepID=A0A645J1U8_9ZZZZ